ncbi:enolase C-terminal domain-like protein [Actinoplanes xinjiangensis]|jgi:L-fuconate dehydratase|uniref:L-fuconate dehydratase n=1 Tax=Actinoplanes xinjiangensis TaxID=512350 RepID=A0A316EKL6_9ACTN|nr:enolase C-terminal domain-like protein [Actinoplanes xinjiangensis]PWK31227.1 L-fuconate dehydratase [Actinoplanes xinjiangensis]GIF44094.1 mandelate racemase [Actinoplanes xinjiangensis]
MRITAVETFDIRFPTSRELDGSDAMNPDPDYSAAYVILRTEDGWAGHGFTFTIGRGNEVCRAALDALAPLITGIDIGDLGEFSRRLTHDSQIRWLGPEKGVMQLAVAALINAAWDLTARIANRPLWSLLSEMSPEALVDLVDWRYLTDALTPEAARDLLSDAVPGRTARSRHIREVGYPAYTTSAGWLGYPDEKVDRLARQAVSDGFRQIKLKVGADQTDDVRRFALARNAVGPDIRIAVDANQRWGVTEAIDWMTALAPWDPWWIEEPTSPDDVLGHAAIRRALTKAGPGGGPIRVATGEHVANRIMFKQLLQADAIDFVQLDACRVAGVNENIAILLLAAAFGRPVCPHAGGVGLCEAVQHLSFFDYVAVSGSLDDRVIEYVDHLHEHFTDPVVVERGAYRAPTAPGFSTRMRPESLVRYAYPEGAAWS